MYYEKLIHLLESEAFDEEIIDCACLMGPHELCPSRVELFVFYFLEDKEDELIWRVLHGSEDIAYGAAYFLAWKYDLLGLFFKEFDLVKARGRLNQLGWFA